MTESNWQNGTERERKSEYNRFLKEKFPFTDEKKLKRDNRGGMLRAVSG